MLTIILFPEPKDIQMLLLLNIISSLYLALFYCNRLTVEINREFHSIASWVIPLVPRVQQLSNSIWPPVACSNSTRLFYPIQRPATNWKVLRYHLERCIVISSYLTATEWQNNWAFYEKAEAQSCGHAYDEDTKLKVVALISTLLVFIIVSLGL